MKQLFAFITISLFAAFPLLAQDKILDREGNEQLAKVLEIRPDSILFVAAGDSVHIQAMETEKVFMITFGNGTKEVFYIEENIITDNLSQEEWYEKGKLDARKNYKPNGAFWGALGSTMVFPLVGLGVSTVVAATPPSTANLNIPDKANLQHTAYVSGYRKQARNKKIGSAAMGFVTGICTTVLVLTYILINT